MVVAVQYLAILITSLSMSVHFGTWLTERPMRRTQSGALFTEVHQGRDEIAAKVMPILGNAAIVFIAISLFLVRADRSALVLGLAGLVCVIGDWVVTLRGNVPLNKKVQSWPVDAPPADWSQVRDQWERLHSVRTVLIVCGFALFTASVVFF